MRTSPGRPRGGSVGPDPILPGKTRVPPPPELNDKEKQRWVDTVAAMPAGWFSPESVPLLKLYCRFSVLSDAAVDALYAADFSDMKEYCLRCRAADAFANQVAKLSHALMLSPKSRCERTNKKDETVSNKNRSRPWETVVQSVVASAALEDGDSALPN